GGIPAVPRPRAEQRGPQPREPVPGDPRGQVPGKARRRVVLRPVVHHEQRQPLVVLRTLGRPDPYSDRRVKRLDRYIDIGNVPWLSRGAQPARWGVTRELQDALRSKRPRDLPR